VAAVIAQLTDTHLSRFPVDLSDLLPATPTRSGCRAASGRSRSAGSAIGECRLIEDVR
jgi:hypothetical protein